MIEDAEYEEIETQHEPGDRLLMFSDGAFEIHDSQDKLLGVEGLVRILKALDYPAAPIKMGGR